MLSSVPEHHFANGNMDVREHRMAILAEQLFLLDETMQGDGVNFCLNAVVKG